MLTPAQLLGPLARYRTDEVVVTTMSVTRPWGRLSSSDLDFGSADSAMGHAADLALGIALARPRRRVVCLNGDGSMLMTLGTLATAAGAGAENFTLFVVDNRAYEITGNQPVPAAPEIDYAAIARAMGWPAAYRFDDPRAYLEALPTLLTEPGPVLAQVLVESGTQGPISRSDAEEARYLRVSLAEWARVLRAALAADRPL